MDQQASPATLYGSHIQQFPWLWTHKNETKITDVSRKGPRIKTTQPNSMILVSFFQKKMFYLIKSKLRVLKIYHSTVCLFVVVVVVVLFCFFGVGPQVYLDQACWLLCTALQYLLLPPVCPVHGKARWHHLGQTWPVSSQGSTPCWVPHYQTSRRTDQTLGECGHNDGHHENRCTGKKAWQK